MVPVALAVAALACVGVTGPALLDVGSAAMAAPLNVVVSPLLGPTGGPVTVSGSGCLDDVTVRVVGGATGSEQLERVVVPTGPGGSWAAVVHTPPGAAYVEAACDGELASPVALAAADRDRTLWIFREITATEVIISREQMVDGTHFRVLRADGSQVLGEDLVEGGAAQVVLPRSLGPGRVVILGVGIPPGNPTGAQGLAGDVVLPLPVDWTLSAGPRIASSGQTVTIAGEGCPGSVDVTAHGQADDWYDPYTTYVDEEVVADPSGAWSTTFPMPGEAVAVFARCTVPDADTEPAKWFVLGSLDGPFDEADVTLTPTGAVVRVGVEGDVQAFTPAGEPVPLSAVPGEDGAFEVDGRPGPLVIVGLAMFGENADPEAVSFESPQQYLADISEPVTPPPPPTAGPGPSGRAVPGRILAETGPTGATAPAAFVGLALLLVGAALARSARGRNASTG